MSNADVINHHLRLFGIAGAVDGPRVLDRPGQSEVELARQSLGNGQVVIAVIPNAEFVAAFGLTTERLATPSPIVLKALVAGPKIWSRVRTLHAAFAFHILDEAKMTPVVIDDTARIVWGWLPYDKSGILLVGTDLAADLIRYRQGDPALAVQRPTEAQWGIAGERPGYLFDTQLEGEAPSARHADWWCEALSTALTFHGSVVRKSMLPDGAPGAVVVTGDDDQAFLETYARQRELLGDLPVTYFLHPLTKHTKATLAELGHGRRMELGIHPDALEEPHRYGELFDEQSNWFERLTGRSARTVRNHGFLNDGYWGHLQAWRSRGIVGSSNIPGLDGRVVNGSLLPARVSLDGTLTEHWSLLTAIGDGVVFIHGWDDVQSAACIKKVAQEIRASGVPGVIVLNLHPQNVDRTEGMHHAAREIAASGFVAWNFEECIEWFAARDEAREPKAIPALPPRVAPPLLQESDAAASALGAFVRRLRKLLKHKVRA